MTLARLPNALCLRFRVRRQDNRMSHRLVVRIQRISIYNAVETVAGTFYVLYMLFKIKCLIK